MSLWTRQWPSLGVSPVQADASRPALTLGPEVFTPPVPSAGEALGQQAGRSADRPEEPGPQAKRVGSGKGVEGTPEHVGLRTLGTLPEKRQLYPQKLKSFGDPQGRNAVSLGTGAQ